MTLNNDSKYDQSISQWNQIFSKETSISSIPKTTGNEAFDKGIMWVCEGTERILDFGCGKGSLLFMCIQYGTKKHMGIDLSEEGIQNAKRRAEQNSLSDFEFIHGSIEKLEALDENAFDAVILSNIVDNLYPEDAEKLMMLLEKIVRENGKIFVKLNPHLSQAQIEEWNITIIEDNLLDDGFVLWNNTTEDWREFFEKRFRIEHYEDIYFPEHEQYNRMFFLINNKFK